MHKKPRNPFRVRQDAEARLATVVDSLLAAGTDLDAIEDRQMDIIDEARATKARAFEERQKILKLAGGLTNLTAEEAT